MGRSLRFYKNSVLTEKRKVKPLATKTVVTLGECIFLSPSGFEKHSGPIDIEFKIGEQVKFLGKNVTIRNIMLDDNQNVIYRVEYEDTTQTSIHQDLLTEESLRREPFSASKKKKPDKTNFQDFAIKEETISATHAPTSDSPYFEETPVVESQRKVNVTKNQTPVVKSERNINVSKSQKEIKVSEILEFLNLKDSSGELEQLENVLKIYKFLVQNSEYDEAIVEDMDPKVKSYSIEPNEHLINTRKTALAFQHLLFKLGISSQIVISSARKDSTLHNALLVKLSKKSYFFDVEQERIYYAQSNTFPYLVACLGMDEYNKDYNILGVLPQDGSSELLSLPSNVSEKRIFTMILTGYDRSIHDLTYSKKEKRME